MKSGKFGFPFHFADETDFLYATCSEKICLLFIIYYVLLICALLSLFFSHWRTILLPGSIIALGTLLLLFVGHGEARFHIPFMPFIIMMAALSLNKLMKR